MDIDFSKYENIDEETKKSLIDEINSKEADLKKEWDSKANTNAEKILDGAFKEVYPIIGIERKRGEHIADYLKNNVPIYLDGALKAEKEKLEEKLKSTPEYGEEFEKLKSNYAELQKKEAEYEKLIKEDYKGKYEDLLNKQAEIEENLAFNSTKPTFPETLNKYEAKARWEEWVNKIKENYFIKYVDGEGVAVDKENEYKTFKLNELLKQDDGIQNALKGREIKGLSHEKPSIKIEGLPFEIKKDGTDDENQESIRIYLSKKYDVASDKYAEEFAKYNDIIKSQKNDENS